MNGILLVDKSEDWTSHDVVAKLRGLVHERRAGHSGTLDPMATGLLVVFFGRATRAVEFAEADRKEYAATIRFGVTTDTQDITGRVLRTAPAEVTPEALEAALARFRGEIEQIPPMYSALKVDGKKLYELARKGREVERKARKITIYDLKIDGEVGAEARLLVQCSKGTYIRTLCHDIGQTLGCGACMSALHRTRAGVFSVEQAHTLPEIAAAAEAGRLQELILPTDVLFSEYPRITLTAGRERCIRNGGFFSTGLEAGRYRVYSAEGEFLALAASEDGVLRAIKSFYEV